ncbi:ankryin [Piscirickettsia salmonis]|uniref:ankyrin repeat domain-containing protein n=1 Tax=Piscirickettsia salmonis TaxID=1238 RepID=UPI00030DD64E|nr:ankyrin repeat domain-containing protein [Piscirickettsia salmonis]ALA25073.1 ankyrin repeat family protein [Piscirickettsia salmonis]APS45354.1 ankryin [Piscirickettsia salmonis]APS48714.1 ankryin [Piscirickettsia salmonis]APS49957.1 ankryin [Piscirickettsia salmonis]APS53150.1 ankryin [Piscirickettsia salmonis]
MSVPRRQLQEELQTAGQGGSENLVSKVISKYRANDKNHALRRAAAKGDREDVIALLDYGADINSFGPKSKKTALHFASTRKHEDVIKLLLERGANPFQSDLKGEAAVTVAYRYGNSKRTEAAYCRSIVKMMKDNGGQIAFSPTASWYQQMQAKYPQSAFIDDSDRQLVKLFFPGMMGEVLTPEELRRILEKYPQLLKHGLVQGKSLLSMVVGQREGLQRKLIMARDFGASPNVSDVVELAFAFGNTPLHTLVVDEGLADARLFIDLFAEQIDPTITDVEGKTTLLLSVKMRDIEITSCLLEKGFADRAANIPDEDGNTPLHYAYALGSEKLARLLREHGAADQPNNAGLLPRDMLTAFGEKEVRETLLSVSIIPEREFGIRKSRNILVDTHERSFLNVCLRDKQSLLHDEQREDKRVGQSSDLFFTTSTNRSSAEKPALSPSP